MNQRSDNEIQFEIENETGSIEGPWRPLLGSLLLATGTGMYFVATIAGPPPAPFALPVPSGYGFLAALVLGILGVNLLRQPHEGRDPDWQPQRPGVRFTSIELYTRTGCHLCHQALDVLLTHAEFLPPVQEIDIDSDPGLVEQYGDSIPVVVIDGRERFRGQVNVLLLRRLIEATSPRVTPLVQSLDPGE